MQSIRRRAYFYLFFQTIIIVFASAVAGIEFSSQIALSLLLAGTLAILPNIFLVKKAFASISFKNTKKIWRAFLLGEAGKIVMTVLLLITFLKFTHLNIVAFLVGYTFLQLMIFIAPIFLYPPERGGVYGR